MLLGLAVVVLIVGWIIIEFSRRIPRDEITMCPLNGRPSGHTLVMVDWTDPFTEQQRNELRGIIYRLKNEIAVDEKLSVHIITANVEDSAIPVKYKGVDGSLQEFNKCKPLDPNKINPLVENERRQKEKWEASFGRPLEQLLAKLLEGSEAPQSPILEAIDVIMWGPDFQGNLPARRLVIVSDLLQNTNDQTHLKGPLPDVCSVMETPLGRSLKSKNWERVTVVLHYWRNPKWQLVQQRPEHFEFWARLFSCSVWITLCGMLENCSDPTT